MPHFFFNKIKKRLSELYHEIKNNCSQLKKIQFELKDFS
jgi:hypothetical protein